jgi:hypothetical protein
VEELDRMSIEDQGRMLLLFDQGTVPLLHVFTVNCELPVAE